MPKRIHGNYYNGKIWCDISKKLIQPGGWHRHLQSHQPGGAPFLKKGARNPYPTKHEELNGVEENLVTIEVDIKEAPTAESAFIDLDNHGVGIATRVFPNDPLRWNALLSMLQEPVTPEGLRAAAGFLLYKAKVMEDGAGVN